MRWLSFDIETTRFAIDRIGFCHYDDTADPSSPGALVTGSFTWNTAARALTKRLLVENESGADYLVAHNSTYDLDFLGRAGFLIDPALIFDTMQAAALLHTDLPKALGAMWRYYRRPMKPWKWHSTASPVLYNAQDAEFAALIAPVLYRGHEGRGSLDLLLRGIMPSISVVERMSKTGIPMDRAALRRWRSELQAQLAESMTSWEGEFPGISPTTPADIIGLLHTALGFPVLKTTDKTNKPSTKQKDLIDLTRLPPKKRPPAENFTRGCAAIESRGKIVRTAKVLSTFANEAEIGADGRLHPRYLPTSKDSGDLGTAPGRLSSSPNIQNRPPAARGHFVPPRPGWLLIDSDLSAVEGRVQAALAGDQDLLAAYNDATRDLHSENGSAIQAALQKLWTQAPRAYRYRFGEEGSPQLIATRKLTKNFKYAFDYGAALPTLAKTLTLNLEEAAAAVSAYEGLWPVTAQWRREIISLATERRYLVNPFGRRRNFHGIRSSDGRIRAHIQSAAINFLPQSTVADIFWMLFPSIEATIHSFDGELFTQGHDSVLWACHRDRLLPAVAALGLVLEREWPQIAPGFRVPCAHAVGLNWRDCKPLLPQGPVP